MSKIANAILMMQLLSSGRRYSCEELAQMLCCGIPADGLREDCVRKHQRNMMCR